LRKDYPQVLADLARYDGMRGSSSAGEFAAAALGQFGGGLPTPESLVGVPAKAATLLRSVAKAGLQQGAANAAVDPVVQALNINTGVQKTYDPARTATSAGLGLVTGAAARSAAEVLGGVATRQRAENSAVHALKSSQIPAGTTDWVPNPFRYTWPSEGFLRYESNNIPYSRVTPSQGLRPGTFAALIESGIQPQPRLNQLYNLPTPEIPRSTYVEINPPPVR